jgi:hypothetical protein
VALDKLKVPPPTNPKKVERKGKSDAKIEDQDSKEQSPMLLSMRASLERIGES